MELEFEFSELIFPAALIFVTGMAISWVMTRSLLLSSFLSFIKSFIFLVYYAFFFDGTWTFLDDWTYLERGRRIVEEGVGALNFLSHIPFLLSISGSRHFFYYLVNAEAIRILGFVYYAPVVFNIVLTFVAAAFLVAGIEKGLGLSRHVAIVIFAALVLYPDVVAWSTVMNGKDTWVMAGVSVFVYAISQAGLGRYGRVVVLCFMAIVIMFLTRFYIPLVMFVSLILAFISLPSQRRSLLVWGGVIGSLGVMILVIYPFVQGGLLARFQEAFVNPLYGIPRFIMTPIPFNTEPNYSFLDFPQIIHWVLLPFLGYGVLIAWNRATLVSRFMVVYFVLIVLLYGMYGELQGPRHRYQLDGFIVVFQVLGVLALLKRLGMTICSAQSGHDKTSQRPCL